MPGGAWSRHQVNLAARELGEKPPDTRMGSRPRGREMEETFGLFSGNRALSENLQLDRALRIVQNGSEASVRLDTIRGVEIREMDWRPLVRDLRPETDPLAALIPADQHAIFFPTFEAAVALADEADRDSASVLNLMEPQSEDSRAKERYQRQLCLSLSGLGRLIGPQVIKSMAITGSDPYWRLGSDVAVIFEPKDMAALRKLLSTQMAMATAGRRDIRAARGDGPLYSTSMMKTPDRSICSYVAQIGDALVVSNSPRQLERIAQTRKGEIAALATQPEYIFFRDRYKRGNAEETSFLILTDATIRRWCGPKWRIADSRRTRALAAMSAEQAKRLDELVKGTAKPAQVQSEAMDVGPLEVTPAGISSPVYGTMEFMTPIVELDFDSVTREEATAYEQWRDSYQRDWNQYFDPIAIRFTISAKKLAADVSVMPLIARSEYGEFVELSRGVKISDAATDRHGARAFCPCLEQGIALDAPTGEPRKLARRQGEDRCPRLDRADGIAVFR